jgi:hypothetical protein
MFPVKLAAKTTPERSRNGTRRTTCCKCAKPLEGAALKYGCYCGNCRNEINRKAAKKYADLSPEEKKKRVIRETTRRAVKKGLIPWGPCDQCGSIHSQIHHPDYNKPMEIRWLCSLCHGREQHLYNMSLSQKTWRAEYKRLFLQDLKRQSPAFYASGGGDTYQVKIPSEKKANGLTQIIIKFLKLSGHYANRISTQGQARRGRKAVRFEAFTNKVVYTDDIKWTKGTTTKGTPDIDAIIYGRAVKIEVKVGKDRMSEDQLKQKNAIEGAGALYFVARDMQSFYNWYYENFAK